VSDRDPFSLTYDTIWEMLEDVNFSQRVKVGNRIKFSTAGRYRDPQLLAVLSEDRPVVGVLQATINLGLERSSSTSFITPQYQIVLVCGDTRLDVEFYPCLWDIIVASLDWWNNLRTLLYGGVKFIHMAEPVVCNSAYVDNKENKGIKGWVGRLDYKIEMSFQTTAIRLS
jgi:hypothetical protein